MQYTLNDIKNFLIAIKQTIPLWILGTEEFSHQSGLINIFQALAVKNPQLGEVSRKLSLLMWMQNPLDKAAAQKCLELNNQDSPIQQLNLLKAITALPKL